MHARMFGGARLELECGDVTAADVDAIVNAANGRCSAGAASTG